MLIKAYAYNTNSNTHTHHNIYHIHPLSQGDASSAPPLEKHPGGQLPTQQPRDQICRPTMAGPVCNIFGMSPPAKVTATVQPPRMRLHSSSEPSWPPQTPEMRYTSGRELLELVAA